MEQAHIVKHQLSSFMNEHDDINVYRSRIFSDVSTNSFVKTILSNANTRNSFVDFLYHRINTNIKININKKLVEKYNAPMMGNDIVQLIYKGGNIMNMYGIKHLDHILRGMRMEDRLAILDDFFTGNTKLIGKDANTIGNIIEILKGTLSVSDVDFSVHIYSDSYYRFYEMYEIVYDIINKELEYISNLFENLLSDNFLRDDVFNEHEEIFDIYFAKQTAFIQGLIHCAKHKVNTKSVNLPNPMSQDYLQGILDDFNDNNKYNLEYLLSIYEYLEYFSYINGNIAEVTQYKNIIYNLLENIVKYKEYLIVNSDFYSRDKILLLKQSICNEFINISDRIYYECITDKEKLIINTTRKNSDPNINDIDIIRRNSFIIRSINDLDFYKKENISNEKVHYITYNNIINVFRCGNYIGVNFDLVRIKFNIVVKGSLEKYIDIKNENKVENIVNIPSEFLDISIPLFGDYNYNHTLRYDNVILTSGENKLQVNAYNLRQICDDLSFILFRQQYYCPWIDNKYEKRVVRFMYFSFMDIYRKEDDIKIMINLINVIREIYNNIKNGIDIRETINNSGIVAYDYLEHTIKNYENSDSNLPFASILLIDSRYLRYKDMIASILLLAYMQKLNTIEYIKLVNILRARYNYKEYEVSEEVHKLYKTKFLEFLSTILICGIFLQKIENYKQSGGFVEMRKSKRYYISKKKPKEMIDNKNIINTPQYLKIQNFKYDLAKKSFNSIITTSAVGDTTLRIIHIPTIITKKIQQNNIDDMIQAS